MASAGTAKVAVEGLGQLRRDLRAINKELPRELGKDVRGATERSVLPAARSLTPHLTGESAASERVSVAGTRVALRSAKPWMNVLHWGGTTGKGHRPGVGGSGSVKVRGTRFFEKAAEEKAEAVLQGIADGVDGLLVRHGFK